MKKCASLHSKRGVSLVEEICAVCVLAIGIFAAVALISLSRTSVSSDGVKDAAAAQAQQLADNLIARMSQQPVYAPPPSVTVEDVGGISAADVCEEANLGAAGHDKQFCITPRINLADAKTDGYQIVCRVYYNGHKNYVQFHAYASARGNS